MGHEIAAGVTVLIVEDEAPAARRLAKLVQELRPAAQLLGPCDTVSAAAQVLAQAAPDLMLCDIELADGLSFRLWEQHEVRCPVIFTTAYDQYALRAFRVNSVDYLLKPIDGAQLEEAFARFEQLRQPGLAPGLADQLLAAMQNRRPAYRTRVVTTQAGALVPLPIERVAHFYSEDRLTFAVDQTGKPHLLGESIARLTEELDPATWFQINRGQLVHVDAVVKAAPYFNHRLKLSLKPAVTAPAAENIVARERTGAFRTWLGGR